MVTIIDISDNMIKIELCVFLLQGTETTKKEGQAGKQKKIVSGSHPQWGDSLSRPRERPLLVCCLFLF